MHQLMMFSRMMLGDVVGQVGFSWFPVHLELVLFDSVSDPVKPHVNGLGSLNFNIVIGNPTGSGVVDKDWCCWLRVTHFVQHGT